MIVRALMLSSNMNARRLQYQSHYTHLPVDASRSNVADPADVLWASVASFTVPSSSSK